MQVVKAAGIALLTDDVVLIAVMTKCAELDRALEMALEENRALRHQETARFRTLRRDVHQIKRTVLAPPAPERADG